MWIMFRNVIKIVQNMEKLTFFFGGEKYQIFDYYSNFLYLNDS